MIRESILAAGLGAALSVIAWGTPTPARGCNLGLAFALDSTSSLSVAQVHEMRRGLAAALVHPEVAGLFDAHGVSVYVYEWAGERTQRTIVDWTAPGAAGAAEGALRLAADEAVGRGATAIGEALLHGYAAFLRSGCWDGALNLVADGYGGGDAYVGMGPAAAREQIDRWFPINVVLVAAPHLEADYREWVLQGPAPFVIHAEGPGDFAAVMRRKIVLELALLVGGAE
jgi:hypothetical protein